MKFDNTQAVLWAFTFLLPGFVWSAVYAMLIPRKLDTEQIRFMEFFTLSSLNNAFWSWLIYLSYVKRIYINHQACEALIVFLIVFVSPAIAAAITATFKQKGWSARFIEWLGFRSALHITTAWDFKLSTTGPVWMNVQLKNGDRIYGLFGTSSFAGDAMPTADLYLEQTLKLTEDGQSFQDSPNKGIWIAPDQIATIEFVGSAANAD
jgi:hypothetical protein